MSDMKKIPFSPPDITEEEVKEVVEALYSGWITTGPKTKEFEKKIAAYCQTEKAVCLNSATACLELTLRLLGIGPGDEVITSAYTYTASASPIAHVGAKIVLVDCEKDSYEIDCDALCATITPRTKAVIPVDVGGILCHYDRIFAAVEGKKSLFTPANDIQAQIGRVAVLADGAHSFGARRGDRRSGALADFTTFSFHAVKNLTTAEGGGVTWNPALGLDNEALYHQYQLMSLHGQSKDALAKTKLGAWEYDIVAPLYKCNMTDIMAGLGLAQLRRYPSLLEKRYELVRLYDALLADTGVELPRHFDGDMVSSCHLYLTRLTGRTPEERGHVISAMAEQGVVANVHYKPLPMMTAYQNLGFSIAGYPNAYARFANEVTLPLYSTLTEEDVERVCRTLKEVL
ncbi:MAG: DegT/DnrJ/EryC1/StrS aminotransferase family protein [Oscillibacter sp.]|nr:DegT/DnrJ/EryC1/StrS aminotransferase family protein [Oscillibacter sp.]